MRKFVAILTELLCAFGIRFSPLRETKLRKIHFTQRREGNTKAAKMNSATS
jgi:hypothetical protein